MFGSCRAQRRNSLRHRNIHVGPVTTKQRVLLCAKPPWALGVLIAALRHRIRGRKSRRSIYGCRQQPVQGKHGGRAAPVVSAAITSDLWWQQGSQQRWSQNGARTECVAVPAAAPGRPVTGESAGPYRGTEEAAEVRWACSCAPRAPQGYQHARPWDPFDSPEDQVPGKTAWIYVVGPLMLLRNDFPDTHASGPGHISIATTMLYPAG
ncbi:hypothetical protein NDU88_004265 [Pleurodeles waltl]|uniref:Uncharacterized protein n=1 Tax=Pleurodeles waltl TaxID=8319 RepID=A0AAV7VJB9_PLEWA|nr:hypothetical protein NDU88_004265 [Pleurodeles waltl]